MALFIASLALGGDALNNAKVGILVGSAVSAAFGMVILAFASKGRSATRTAEPAGG